MEEETMVSQELESLVGLLHHAAKVVAPGRSFLHRMIALLKGIRHRNHHIRLNKEFKADLQWWLTFMETWNGVSVLPPPHPSTHIASDASGSWGCGALCNGQWFQLQWPTSCQDKHISFKELIPIVLAVMVWGHEWRGSAIHCQCDNQAVVCMLASRYSRQTDLMHLLRCLFFLEATYRLTITASHIPGRMNTLADDLSRNNIISFFSQAPYMHKTPTPLPLMALNLLLDPKLDWTSPSWMVLFRATVGLE